MILDLADDTVDAILRLADQLRALRGEVAPVVERVTIDDEVAERVRLLRLRPDKDGAMPCGHCAAALGRSESALRWHCGEDSGPPKLPARRGHRHRLSDCIKWEKAQTALINVGEDVDRGGDDR
ncbi:MAG TPA: hypothetical protein VHW66_09355 [Stellaceae bacterium]|jgi:hypothetical protein|nr:hypothetical protein [Stellaceae bacterium]